MADVDDNRPKLKKLTDGINSFIDMFKRGEWADIAVRIVVFAFLVFLTHTFIVWVIYRVVLPFVEMWFYDQVFDELTKRLENVEWGGFQLAELVRK